MTIKEYINSFKHYSKNNIFYSDKYNNIELIKDSILKNNINIICIFYTCVIEISNNNDIYNYLNSLKSGNKKIICFLQDEYLYLNSKIKLSKICDYVFINIQEKDAKDIFKINTNFKTILTGYVPENLKKIQIKNKNMDIFYRGRTLHYAYGELGYDKINIGKKFKNYCLEYNKTNSNIISYNIEWDENSRIYNNEWYKILSNSKTTLATESGCKIFELDTLTKKINLKFKNNKSYSYKECVKDFQFDKLKKYKTCEVSPKMFEAVSCGTVLIMYPGCYKDIFIPNVHYIELKKDFSNIKEVIEKIKDDEYLQKIADRAYEDLIKTGKYSYKTFIKLFDNMLE